MGGVADTLPATNLLDDFRAAAERAAQWLLGETHCSRTEAGLLMATEMEAAMDQAVREVALREEGRA